MPAPKKFDKKTAVKHRTRAPFQHRQNDGSKSASSATIKGKGKSGFKVGPSHAPDGAYLGRAKRIKAALIEKAKVKKMYYKQMSKRSQEEEEEDRGQGEASMLADQAERDEGRFAPEQQGAVADGMELIEGERVRARQRRTKGEEQEGKQARSRREEAQLQASKEAERKAMRRLQGGTMFKARESKQDAVIERQQPQTTEERKEQRKKRQEQWNAESGSVKGRQRGQPNLGARMDLLLNRIQRS